MNLSSASLFHGFWLTHLYINDSACFINPEKMIQLLCGRLTKRLKIMGNNKVQGWSMNLRNDTRFEAFCFTSDATREYQVLFQLHFKLLTEEKCCSEIESGLRRRMTELIDKLIEEGKIFAAAIMRHNRDLLICHQRGLPSTKCPILRFLNECVHAIGLFVPHNFETKYLSYIAWMIAP